MAVGDSPCSSSQLEEGELVSTHPLPSLPRSFSAVVSGKHKGIHQGQQLRLHPVQPLVSTSCLTSSSHLPRSYDNDLQAQPITEYSAYAHNQQALSPPLTTGQTQPPFQPPTSTTYNVPDLALLKPVSQHEGKKAVLFPYSDKSNMVQKLKFVLVGKFSHGRPAWSKIKIFLQDLKLLSSYNVAVIDHKHIVIECSCKNDFYKIWLKLVWFIHGYAMRVFKWGPAFSSLVESPIAPVWIRLEGLPLHMFDEMSLWSISNAIGNPIRIDPRNLNRSMLNSARVCVELDVSQPLIDSLCICFKDEVTGTIVESFCAHVYYDVVPFYCSGCSHIGHQVNKCKRKQLISFNDKNCSDLAPAITQQIASGHVANVEHLTRPLATSKASSSCANGTHKHQIQVWQPVEKIRATKIAGVVANSLVKGITVSNCFNALDEDRVNGATVSSYACIGKPPLVEQIEEVPLLVGYPEQSALIVVAPSKSGQNATTALSSSTTATNGLIDGKLDLVSGAAITESPDQVTKAVRISVGVRNVHRIGPKRINHSGCSSFFTTESTEQQDQIFPDRASCKNIKTDSQTLQAASIALSDDTRKKQVRSYPTSTIGIGLIDGNSEIVFTAANTETCLQNGEVNNRSEHTVPSDEQNSQSIQSVSVTFSEGTHAEQVKGHPGSSIDIIAANADHNQKGNNAATTAQYRRLQSTKVDMAMHNNSDQIVTILQQNPSTHSSIATSDQHALDRIQQITEQIYLKQIVQAIEQAIVQERIQGHELNDLADFSPNSLLYGDFVGMEDKSNNLKFSTVCPIENRLVTRSNTGKSANGDLVAVPADDKLSSYISKCNRGARKRLQTRSCRDYDSSDWTEADTDDGCVSKEEEEEDNNFGTLSYCDELNWVSNHRPASTVRQSL